MQYVAITAADPLATVTLSRGKVNAVNQSVVNELRSAFERLESAPDTRAVILTGRGSFFSFGFDVPELYDLPPDDFTAFLRSFADLCRCLFAFPKPVVAAINGHAVAGGCILATVCDRRIMVPGKARLALNELTFGSTIFQTAIELMRYWVGSRTAEDVIFSGRMFSAEQARAIGLVDTVAGPEQLLPLAAEAASALVSHNPESFAHAKSILRQPVLETMAARDEASIKRFVEIWYSPAVRELLKGITIRG